jgi:hypothetical protein
LKKDLAVPKRRPNGSPVADFPRMNPPFGVKHMAIRSDTLSIAAFGPATLVRGRLGAAPGTKRGGPFLFLSIEAVVGFP